MSIEFTPLPPNFYKQPTLSLAKNLLGCILVNHTKEGTTSGYIVETEAYLGANDRAAHSYGNRRTKRTEIMFHEPGLAYIYQMHTHQLVNVVSGPIGTPEAVLIRAVEPYTGIDIMLKRRPVHKLNLLTNGPGKLSKALGITIEDYGKAFHHSSLIIAKGKKTTSISQGRRIGIDNAGDAKEYPYRFWVSDNPFVSR